MPPILFCACVGVEAVGGVAAGGVEDFCWGAGLAPCVIDVYIAQLHVHVYEHYMYTCMYKS